MSDESPKTIRTSEKGWFANLALAYSSRHPVVVVDDAEVGIDPREQTLLQLAREKGLSRRELYAVGSALGLSTIGVGMLLLAFFDPEPTSKLGLLVGGGTLTILTGGAAVLKILVNVKPPNVEIVPGRVSIRWD